MSRISRMFASILGAVLASKAVEDLPRHRGVSQSGPPYGRAAHKRNQRQRRKLKRQRGYK